MGYKMTDILEDKDVRASYIKDLENAYDRVHGYDE